MKRFLLKLLLFFTLFSLVDLICGWGFSYLKSKARGGMTYNSEFISNHCESDILILGSSKAARHYVPTVFEDSLQVSCYNAGTPGCGIIPAYVRYKMVSERQKPQLVLYEVTPNYDYQKDNGYSTYLGTIRQYTDRKWIRDVYLDFSDNLEGIRLLSSMYRNNSKVVMNIQDILTQPDKWKGYSPLYGTINQDISNKVKISSAQTKQIDSLKYHYVERLIKETKADGVQFAFIISPSFNGDKEVNDYLPAFELSNKYNIPIIDNRDCELFVNQREYFHDIKHFNHKGSIAYSQYVSQQIENLKCVH